MANTQVQCPNCGSFATKPTHGEGLGREQDAPAKIRGDFSFGRNRFSFDNPEWVHKFKNLEVSAFCETCKFVFKANTVITSPSADALTSNSQRPIAERLTELDKLRVAGAITEHEYKRKREEILGEGRTYESLGLRPDQIMLLHFEPVAPNDRSAFVEAG